MKIRLDPISIEVMDLTTASIARKELLVLTGRSGEPFDLARACFLVAVDELGAQAPEDDTCLQDLDRLATRGRHTCGADAPIHERLAALQQVFFVDADFVGSHEDYYDLDNVLLPRVLERRRGLPILLSILYIEVARRMGIEADPVAFPGHVLVRIDLDDGFLIIDPFNRGRRLDRRDCIELLIEVTDRDHTFDEEMLAPSTELEILTRVLLNLRRAHLMAGDIPQALRVQDLVVAINLESIPARRDRARLFARLGAHRMAAIDFERCIEIGPRTGALYKALQHEALLARQRSQYLA